MSAENYSPIQPESPYLPLKLPPEAIGSDPRDLSDHYDRMVSIAEAIRLGRQGDALARALDNPDNYRALIDVCADSASNPGLPETANKDTNHILDPQPSPPYASSNAFEINAYVEGKKDRDPSVSEKIENLISNIVTLANDLAANPRVRESKKSLADFFAKHSTTKTPEEQTNEIEAKTKSDPNLRLEYQGLLNGVRRLTDTENQIAEHIEELNNIIAANPDYAALVQHRYDTLQKKEAEAKEKLDKAQQNLADAQRQEQEIDKEWHATRGALAEQVHKNKKEAQAADKVIKAIHEEYQKIDAEIRKTRAAKKQIPWWKIHEHLQARRELRRLNNKAEEIYEKRNAAHEPLRQAKARLSESENELWWINNRMTEASQKTKDALGNVVQAEIDYSLNSTAYHYLTQAITEGRLNLNRGLPDSEHREYQQVYNDLHAYCEEAIRRLEQDNSDENEWLAFRTQYAIRNCLDAIRHDIAHRNLAGYHPAVQELTTLYNRLANLEARLYYYNVASRLKRTPLGADGKPDFRGRVIIEQMEDDGMYVYNTGNDVGVLVYPDGYREYLPPNSPQLRRKPGRRTR